MRFDWSGTTLSGVLSDAAGTLRNAAWPEVMNTLDDVKEAYFYHCRFDPAGCQSVLETSTAYAAVQDLVFAEPRAVREAAVYTLGKCCSPQALPILYHAFEERCDTDPLLLPRLLGEVQWLENTDSTSLLSSCVERVLNSPNFLSRWSLLEEGQGFTTDAAALSCLTKDQHPLVAAEARHRQQGLRLQQNITSFPKGERKRIRKHYAQQEPLTFFHMTNKFLQTREKPWSNYSVDELTVFVEAMTVV